MDKSPVRILLGDSSDLILIGAQQTLAAYPDCKVQATATNFAVLSRLAQRLKPDVIIFGDVLDPDRQIWDQITDLRAISLFTHLVLINNRISGLIIRELLAHGVAAILCKQDSLENHLYPAVLAVCRHRPYLSPIASTEYLVEMQSANANRQLPSEARQILQLLAHGEHAGQISNMLGIDKRRVYWIRQKLRQRFGAKTNEHLIQRACAEGFLYPCD